MDGEHKPAFRMLYYWTQINDMVRSALIFNDPFHKKGPMRTYW